MKPLSRRFVCASFQDLLINSFQVRTMLTCTRVQYLYRNERTCLVRALVRSSIEKCACIVRYILISSYTAVCHTLAVCTHTAVWVCTHMCYTQIYPVLSVCLSTPGIHPKIFGFDDAKDPKVVSIYRPEFAQDHESGLRSDWGTVVLCYFFDAVIIYFI